MPAEIIATRSTSDWVDILSRLDIPVAPVIGLDELVYDEHLDQTDFFHELSDEDMGHMRFPGVPVRFNGVRPGIGMPPRLGEHTVEVLAAAGLSSAEIEQLLFTGAAFQHTFDHVDRASARYKEFGGAHV